MSLSVTWQGRNAFPGCCSIRNKAPSLSCALPPFPFGCPPSRNLEHCQSPSLQEPSALNCEPVADVGVLCFSRIFGWVYRCYLRAESWRNISKDCGGNHHEFKVTIVVQIASIIRKQKETRNTSGLDSFDLLASLARSFGRRRGGSGGFIFAVKANRVTYTLL